MVIEEVNETALNTRSQWEINRKEYNGVKIYNSIEECIKSLGSYTKTVLLPNGSEVIPDFINYPQLQGHYILKPVRFPIFETIAENI